MTTIVAGEGLGLASATPLAGGGEANVNASNGNLVLQVQDEWLASSGLDVAVGRTYNSQGLQDDDNADNWRIGLYRGIASLSGALNAAGSSVVRVDGDGARHTFAYDAALAKYVDRSGEGAFDTLAYDGAGARWTWTDGDSRVTETYDWSGGNGKLLQVADADGNRLAYTYTGSLLTLVTDASGEKTFLDYSGNNLAQVRVVHSDGSTRTRVRYGYDASNRLNKVTVDLSPDDNSIADGRTFVTSYTYDGTSKRLAGVSRSDGSSLAFTYVQVGGRYCVASVTDALGQVTRYSYACAAWSAPALMESGSGTMADPQLGFDALGNGFALWREGGNLWARRYTRATDAWGTAQNLSVRADAVSGLQFAVDEGGNAIAAWVQYDGTANSIQVRRYNAAAGTWSAVETVEAWPTAAADPQVAINAAGKAVVAWRQPASGTTAPNNLYASRFDGSAWSAPALLESSAADITAPATVALDADGNASVAWLQDATASMYLARYTASSNTWSAASGSAIESGASAASNVQIAFDRKGNGQAIYLQGGNLYARSYSAASNAWGTTKLLENGANPVTAARLSVSGNGNALVSWVQSDGLAASVHARRCINGAWLNNSANADTGQLLESLSTAAVTPHGTIDDAGDAVVSWRQPAASGGVNSLYASRCANGAWQAAERVDTGTNDVASAAAAMDAQGNLQLVWVQSDGTAPSIYASRHANARMVQTDALGAQTTVYLDAAGRLAGVKAPSGSLSGFAYDSSGNLVGKTDALGARTVYEYDASGNCTLERDALGDTVARTYGAKNELLAETRYRGADPDGAGSGRPGAPATTRYAYDAENHLRFRISAEGRVTEYRYNAAGQQTTEIDYAGNLYDTSALAANASPSEATMAGWAAGSGIDRTRLLRTDTSYDFRGQTASVTAYAATDTSGNGVADGKSTTQYVYDPAGRLLKTIAPEGVASTGDATDFITSTTYDGLGRVLSQTDTLGRTTLTQYDDANRRVVLTQADGMSTTRVYDTAGQLVAAFDSDGGAWHGQTSYWYDADGRLRMSEDPTGARHYLLYDADGRQVAGIDGDGRLVEQVYDGNGRLARTVRYATLLGSAALASLVDAQGRPASVALASLRPAATSADRSAWRFYDAAGRLVKQVDEEGAVTTLAYDAAGQLTDEIAYATGVNTAGIGAGTRAGDAAVSPAASANDRRTRHFYDADGQRLATLDPAGYLSEQQYDAAGRLVHTIGYATAAPSSAWAGGTLAQLRPSASSADQHAWLFYDGQDRVVGSLDAEGGLTETRYDANGNRTQETRYASRARLDPASVSASTTLADLRPAASSADHSTRWTYTAQDQVETVTDPHGTITRSTYDNMGRVLRTDTAADSDEMRSARVRYDGLGRLVAELSGEGAALLDALASPTQDAIDDVWRHHGTSYAYDDAGRRISATDANGNTTRYYYDTDGRLTHTINALGEVSESRYDAFGALVKSVRYGSRIGASTLATLDGGLADSALASALAGIADASADSVASLGYDRRGLLTSTTDALGNTDTSSYDVFGQRTSFLQKQSASASTLTRYAYDKRGLQVQQRDDANGLDRLTQAVYDAFGRVVQSTDGNGKATRFSYDRLGRTVTVTDPLNASRRTSYDAFGRVLTQTDALGNVTTSVYDDQARSVTVYTPLGLSVRTVSNRHGETESITDARWNTTVTAYDQDGHVIAVYDPLGTAETRSYDGAGLLVQTVDARGNAVRFDYDAAGRVLTQTVDPGGLDLVTRTAYDAKGQVTRSTDANGVVTQTSYDLDGRVTQVAVDPAGLNLRTAYAYDAQGRTLTVTEGAGSSTPLVTRYTYDALGRRTLEQVDPSGLNLSTRYDYDAEGRVVKRTDALGQGTRYVYDDAGQLAYTIDAASGVVRTDHDAEGRVVQRVAYATPVSGLGSFTLADLQSHVVADAARDRVEKTIYDADGRAVYTLDGQQHVTARTYDAGGNVLQTTDYATPIAADTPATLAGVAAALSASAADRTSRAAYDEANRAVYTLDALGFVVQNSYDANGNVVKTTAYANAVSLGGQPSVADVAGALVADAAADRTRRSAYDTANRKVYDIDALGHVTQTRYDAAGHVTGSTRYANAVNLGDVPDAAAIAAALEPDASRDCSVDCVFDAGGRCIYTLDAQGYVLKSAYDAVGRLTGTVRYPAAVSGYAHPPTAAALAALLPASVPSTAVQTQNRYDTAGRLYESVDGEGIVTHTAFDAIGQATDVTLAYGTADAATTHYAYDKLGRVVETRSAYGTAAESASSKAYDTLGNLVTEIDADGNASHVSYDVLGRKTRSTDALGHAVSYAYNAFGEVSKVTDPRGNAGYFYYDLLGRGVLQVDPMGSAIGSTYDFTGAMLSQTRYATAVGGYSETAMPTPAANAAQDRSTRWAYDRLGRKTRETDAEGKAETYAYDGLGNLASTTNRAGGTTTYTYDRRGLKLSETLPITSTDAGGNSVAVVNRYSYDARGNCVQTIEAAGLPEARTTTFSHDLDNRLTRKRGSTVSVLDANFNRVSAAPTETYTYDRRGNRILTDADGQKTYAYFDAADRQVAQVDAAGTLTTWTRDAAGNVLDKKVYGDAVSASTASVPTPVDAANVRATFFAYDAGNHAVQSGEVAANVYDYAGGLRSNVTLLTKNEYDASGNLVRTVDPNGNSSYTYYDKAGRKTMQVDAAGYGTSWSYDALGNVGAERRYAGQLSATTLAGLSAASDIVALRSEYLASADVANDRITTYAYDRLGRLTRQGVQNVAYASVNATSGALTAASGESVTRYTYDGLGNVLTETNAVGAVTTHAYDAMGRETQRTLPSFTNYSGASDAGQSSTTYNGLGLAVQKTQKGPYGDLTQTLGYDANGWLSSETSADGFGGTTYYEHDIHGNLVRESSVRDESWGRYNGSWNQNVAWFLPDGQGGLKALYNPLSQQAASSTTLRPILADWNGDGRTDVLWYDSASGANRLYLANGDGSFTLRVSPVLAPDIVGGRLLTGDFNGDGRLDMLWYDSATGANRWFFNQGDGKFGRSENNIAASAITGGSILATGDWDGDGRTDVMWWNKATGANSFYRSVGDGTFTLTANPVATANLAGAGTLKFGDFNGDGRTDLLYYNAAAGTNYWFLGSGTGSTIAYTVYKSPIAAANLKGGTDVYTGDWNGDGKTDLLWYDKATGNNRWYLSNGNGTFAGYANPIAAADLKGGNDLVFGDWNGDGRTDVMRSEPNAYYPQYLGNVRWYASNGNGSFSSIANPVDNSTNIVSSLVLGETRLGDYAAQRRLGLLYGDANGSGMLLRDEVRYGYDAMNRQVLRDDRGANVVQNTRYDAWGGITGRGYFGAWTETTEYDAQGRILRSNADQGVTRAYLYDANGNATLRLESVGADLRGLSVAQMMASADVKPTVSVYDKRNLVTELIEPSISFTHEDAAIQPVNGQPTWVVTGQADVTKRIDRKQLRNAFGDVVAEIDGLGRRTDLAYDTLGQLVSKADPETDVTLANGYVTRQRPTTSYYYDLAGQLVGTVDPNGNRSSMLLVNAFENDDGVIEGKVAKEFFADGSSRSYQYDRLGDQRNVVDQLGQSMGYSYEGHQVDTIGNSTVYDHVYTYDTAGNRIEHSQSLWTDSGSQYQREYDKYDAQHRINQSISMAGRRTDIAYYWVDANSGYLASITDGALGGAGVANALGAAGGWMKVTSDGTGHGSWELTDAYGRLLWKRDLGGKDTVYAYNQAGWLIKQTSDRGQNLAYTYYANGDVKSITDSADNTVSSFEYDAEGNRTFEGYTSIPDAQGKRSFYQYSNISYDELNRVKQVTSADYQISYEYDAAGNRRRVLSYYHDGLGGNAATQDYWYLYDSMNRFTVSMGQLAGGRATDASAAARIQKGSTGIDIAYDAAGQRKSATYGSDGHKEEYAYDYYGRLTTTRIDGVLRAERTYDAMGRMTRYREYNNDANHTTRTDEGDLYDADGVLLTWQDNLTKKGLYHYYLANGTLDHTVSYGEATTVTTTYTYEWFDGAKEKEIKVQASNQSAPGWKPGYSQFSYDANGNLAQVKDVAANRTLKYVTNGEGLILRRQEYSGSTLAKTHNWYYANDRKIGDVGNDGQSTEDYVSILGHDKNLSRKEQNKRYQPRAVADFDQNYEPVSNVYPSVTPGSYTVNTGDTLQSVALAVWGDASLWYWIADANGLGASSTLVAGQRLVIPNKVTNLHNNATTFSVYSPGEAIGDVSPTLPDAPAPKVKKSSKKKKSGGCGKVLLGIVIAVVAVVATVVTAGAVLAVAAPATVAAAGGGIGGALAAGTAAVTGGLGTAAGLGAAVIGSAVGSAASQGLAMLAGLQDKFSWSRVAADGLMGGVTAGLGKANFVSKLGVLKGGAAGIANGAIAGSITGTLNQLATRIANPRAGFSWAAVAGAALGGGINALSVVPGGFAAAHPLLAKGANTFVRNGLNQEAQNLLGLQQGFSLMGAANAAGTAIVDALGSASYVPMLKPLVGEGRAKRYNGLVREVVQEGVRWGLVRKAPVIGDLTNELAGLLPGLGTVAAVGQRLGFTGRGASVSPTAASQGQAVFTALKEALRGAARSALSDLGTQAWARFGSRTAPRIDLGHVAISAAAGGLSGFSTQLVGKVARHPSVADAVNGGIGAARDQYFSSRGQGGAWRLAGLSFADGFALKAAPLMIKWLGRRAGSDYMGMRRSWPSKALASGAVAASGQALHAYLSALKSGAAREAMLDSVGRAALGSLAGTGTAALLTRWQGAGSAASRAANVAGWLDGKLGSGTTARDGFDRFTLDYMPASTKQRPFLPPTAGPNLSLMGPVMDDRLQMTPPPGTTPEEKLGDTLRVLSSGSASVQRGYYQQLFQTSAFNKADMPELEAAVQQPGLQPQLRALWRDSFLPQREEQGGWLVHNLLSDTYRLSRFQSSGQGFDTITDIGPLPKMSAAEQVESFVHTHPHWIGEGYATVRPSRADSATAERLGLPGMIITPYSMIYFNGGTGGR